MTVSIKETIMRIKYIGAAAALAIMASGFTAAQAQAPTETTPPAMTSPGATPDGTSTEQAQQTTDHPKAQHTGSACQKAIHASEKALKNSQASPDTIAQAWQHISMAKQEKGSACKDEAKQAQDML